MLKLKNGLALLAFCLVFLWTNNLSAQQANNASISFDQKESTPTQKTSNLLLLKKVPSGAIAPTGIISPETQQLVKLKAELRESKSFLAKAKNANTQMLQSKAYQTKIRQHQEKKKQLEKEIAKLNHSKN